jgi:hypothetical protein
MMPEWYGLRVLLSVHLTQDQPIIVRRTWWERLWSWPWRPWTSTRVQVLRVPSSEALRIGDLLVIHPETWVAWQAARGSDVPREP